MLDARSFINRGSTATHDKREFLQVFRFLYHFNCFVFLFWHSVWNFFCISECIHPICEFFRISDDFLSVEMTTMKLMAQSTTVPEICRHWSFTIYNFQNEIIGILQLLGKFNKNSFFRIFSQSRCSYFIKSSKG
jgi:hypothetical protein